jgi:hypothetical protein
MFFGLTNSPATFQTMMDDIFREETVEGWLFVYMDDIVIATEDDLELHRKHVCRVLQKLQDHDLFLKPEKCVFEQQHIEYLGMIVGEGRVQMDPVKVKGIRNWPTPTTVKEVRSFLGFGNFYKGFISHYSEMARPLYDLTKKNQQWHWEQEHDVAFNKLKDVFVSYPVLRTANYGERFILETDASNTAIGGVLLQVFEDGEHPIGFYSASLTDTAKRYAIYDRELKALRDSFMFFRPYLKGAVHSILIHTDHNNLKYFKEPQKLSDRQARWMEFLQDFDFVIQHIPGHTNIIADLLSRRPDFDGGENSERTTLLPDHLFLQSIFLKEDDDDERRRVLKEIHDAPTGGHPGIANTWDLVRRRYQGPRLREFVEEYVKGCLTCQESKTLTSRKKAPLQPFDTHAEQGLFQYVSMDLITDLPKSSGYDTILTIVDQGCSKAAVFLPCNKTIDGEQTACLYLRHLVPWFGTPKQIISDRDPRFTSKFSRAMCKALGIQQNLSTAFHPRTDGQTERMNAWVEQYLRGWTNTRQDNWSMLLVTAGT